jgi:Tol biopolymer transport system component
MDADGSNNANLTNSPASDDYLPIASPDGGKICFLSDRDGGWDIFIMNSDGSGQRNLTNGPHNPAYYPTWSPDGTRISYSTDTDGDEISDTIFVIDVETGYFQKLTSGRSPHWNPVPILQDDTYHHDDGV